MLNLVSSPVQDDVCRARRHVTEAEEELADMGATGCDVDIVNAQLSEVTVRDCAKKKNSKNLRLLWKWVGGSVQVSLGIYFGKIIPK